jgi:hypothetical protein
MSAHAPAVIEGSRHLEARLSEMLGFQLAAMRYGR